MDHGYAREGVVTSRPSKGAAQTCRCKVHPMPIAAGRVEPGTHVLVIEDEKLLSWSTCKDLKRWGYIPTAAATLAEAREVLARSQPHVILLDIRLPDGRGLDLLQELSPSDRPKVIVTSAFGDVPTVVEAMRLGANDYLSKPFEADNLFDALARIQAVNAPAPAELPSTEDLARLGIYSAHPSMGLLLDRLRRFAHTPRSTVLMLGETGVGKSVFARALHELSDRKHSPFVEINCAAVPQTLIESELMGHERGAFTDARVAKRGLLEEANGGTLLLDEIGDMPVEMQAKLLHFIETRSYRRLGSTREVQADVRIVTATHRDLRDLVATGKFREDLYYRLKVLTLNLPPLRDRVQDIDLLADHFLGIFAREMGSQVTGFSPEARAVLRAFAWPGNVRELRHVIEAAIVLSDRDPLVRIDVLPDEIQRLRTALPLPPELPAGAAPPPPPLPHPTAHAAESPVAEGEEVVLQLKLDGTIGLHDLEQEILRQAMLRCGGNQVQAANLLGVSRDLLRYRLRKFGLLK